MDPFERPDPRILWVLQKAGTTVEDLSKCYLSGQPAFFFLDTQVEGQRWEVELISTRKQIYADALIRMKEIENCTLYLQEELLVHLRQADGKNALPVFELVAEYVGGDIKFSQMDISWDDPEWETLEEEDWDQDMF